MKELNIANMVLVPYELENALAESDYIFYSILDMTNQPINEVLRLEVDYNEVIKLTNSDKIYYGVSMACGTYILKSDLEDFYNLECALLGY